jgi:phosphatidylglycerophosphatase A
VVLRAQGKINQFVNAFILWLAQGFGIGRIPKAPGTFGSVVGLAWFALLLMAGNLGLYLIGCVVGLALSVWLCGAGEKILKARDPGSVVFDEIAAIPICFAGWVALHLRDTGTFPDPAFFFSKQHLLPTLGVFAAFRLFDVWKPWPVRQSQSLPGGWGVTVDDALAAVYVNIVVVVVLLWSGAR